MCVKLASQQGDVGCQMARLLLEHGACPNISIVEYSTRSTPLHIAAKRGLTDLAQMLLEHGAAIGARDDAGRSALHLACAVAYSEGIVPEIVSTLLGVGADPAALDDVGFAPSDYSKSASVKDALLREARWRRRRDVVHGWLRGS